MHNTDWSVLDRLVGLLELFYKCTKKLSHRYANSSLIIPEIMTLKDALSSQQTKVALKGLGQTVTKLLEQMKTRYEPYLENPNLLLATYLDPRWKHLPFKKVPDPSVMSASLSSVEDLIIERFLKHEKEQQVYEEQKRKEEEEAKKRKEQENKIKNTSNKPPTSSLDLGAGHAAAAACIVDVSASECDNESDNTVKAVKPISLNSIFASSAAKLFGDEEDETEVREDIMSPSPDEQHKRIMLVHEINRYRGLKRIPMDEDPLQW